MAESSAEDHFILGSVPRLPLSSRPRNYMDRKGSVSNEPYEIMPRFGNLHLHIKSLFGYCLLLKIENTVVK